MDDSAAAENIIPEPSPPPPAAPPSEAPTSQPPAPVVINKELASLLQGSEPANPQLLSDGVSTRDRRIRKAKNFHDEIVTSFKSPPKTTAAPPAAAAAVAKQDPIVAAGSVDAEDLDDSKYPVAGLAWAKVGSHPWWPCVVVPPKGFTTVSSDLDRSHVRVVGNALKPKKLIYVEFLDTAMAHAWVPLSNLAPYHGVEHFKTTAQELADQVVRKSAKDRILERYSLKMTAYKQEFWDKAIIEADELLKLTPDQRKKAILKKHEDAVGGDEPSESDDQESLNESGEYQSSTSSVKKRKMNDDSLTNDTNSETSNDNQNTSTRSSTRKPLRKEAFIAPEPDSSRKSKRLSTAPTSTKPHVDEQSLLSLKNQLIALTVMPSNLKELKQIALSFNLTEASLLKQYFGFDPETPTDQLELDQLEFVRKVESASRDLDAKASGQSAFPRALCALKHELPMVYVDLLGHFAELKAKTNPYDFAASPENQEEEVKSEPLPPYSASAFYDQLYELSKHLTAHRDNHNKIVELIIELKSSIASKIS